MTYGIKKYNGIPLSVAEKIYHSKNDFYETKDYVIINLSKENKLDFLKFSNIKKSNNNNSKSNDGYWVAIDKITKKEKQITLNLNNVKDCCVCYNDNVLFFIVDNKLIEYDIESDESHLLVELTYENIDFMYCNDNWIVMINLYNTIIFDRKRGETFELIDCKNRFVTCYENYFTIINDVLYFYNKQKQHIVCEDGSSLGTCLGAYNLKTMKLNKIDIDFSLISLECIYSFNDELYFYSNVNNISDGNTCFVLNKVILKDQDFIVGCCFEYKHECVVKKYERYLLYLDVECSDVCPLYVYDFENYLSYKVVEYDFEHSINMKLVSGIAEIAKENWKKYFNQDFKMVGQWLYYVKNDKEKATGLSYSKTYCVDVNKPMFKVEI